MDWPQSSTGRGAYGPCRCCLALGYHKNLMKKYETGEIYHNMIAECFNLFLSANTSLSWLICSACVQAVRQASQFRTMVADNESRQLAVLEKETLFIDVPDTTTIDTVEVMVKNEPEVKVEVEESDEYVDEPDSPEDPVTPKPPDEDYVEGEAELLARCGAAALPTRAALYRLCPGYAVQLDRLRGQIITAGRIARLLEEPQVLYDAHGVVVSEKQAILTNSAVVLECSNAVPFKSRSRAGFPCFYCRQLYDTLMQLREHQTKVHKKSELRHILSKYGPESLVVYVDVEDLKCTLCHKEMAKVEDLKQHLIKVHNKKMYLDFADRVIPFKATDNDSYECQVCGFVFETFGAVERHMNVHFRNYVCRDCGTGFVTKYRLKVHRKSMHEAGTFPCETCKKVFTTQQKHKNHFDTVHKLLKRFKCPKCSERFTEYFQRQKHMVLQHGVAPLKYRCNVCEKSFDRRYTLSRHMKRDHLEERDYQCELCAYKCFTNNELRVHMVKHNGERIFECSVCKKAYARKKTLREHLRIHNNDRRFACAVCGQAFVQKCSLKGHMKTHHHMEFTV